MKAKTLGIVLSKVLPLVTIVLACNLASAQNQVSVTKVTRTIKTGGGYEINRDDGDAFNEPLLTDAPGEFWHGNTSGRIPVHSPAICGWRTVRLS